MGKISSTILLVSGLFFIIVIASLWKIYKKAEKPGWGSLIPFYNYYLLCDIVYHKKILFLLLFVPIVGEIFMIVLMYRLAMAFGKGTGFGLGILFLPFIFLPILAFGNAEYQFRTIQHVSVGTTVQPEGSTSDSSAPAEEKKIDIPENPMLDSLLRPVHAPQVAEEPKPVEGMTNPLPSQKSTASMMDAIASVGFIPSETPTSPSPTAAPETPESQISEPPVSTLDSNPVVSSTPNVSNPEPVVGAPVTENLMNSSVGSVPLQTSTMENSGNGNASFDFISPLPSTPEASPFQIPEMTPVVPQVEPVSPVAVVQQEENSMPSPSMGTENVTLVPPVVAPSVVETPVVASPEVAPVPVPPVVNLSPVVETPAVAAPEVTPVPVSPVATPSPVVETPAVAAPEAAPVPVPPAVTPSVVETPVVASPEVAPVPVPPVVNPSPVVETPVVATPEVAPVPVPPVVNPSPVVETPVVASPEVAPVPVPPVVSPSPVAETPVVASPENPN